MIKLKTIKVKNIVIGEGIPKVIVPIVGKTKLEIINKAKEINNIKIDVVEWRADFYKDVFEIEKVLDTLKDLSLTLKKEIVLLFTFRTKKEGGEKEISMKDYTELNKAVAKSKNVDMIDVEIFSGDDIVKENIKNIHEAEILVIGSNHDFFKTPSKDDIISRLLKAQEIGADIPKIAVMPKTIEDVLILLNATSEMYDKYANRPIVTMSMGVLGVISRISSEVFGSAMTFGAVGEVSAPGQIPVKDLSIILNILNKSFKR
ncbi:type I 3-dehydroquinate dehydratase [Fusobacterium simiae]|uniref:type I 3-dehydroquinate dehydratase n=1 Tax=Fusobacterium TaxID=848 RepID=UPI0020C53649|nr:type I 3-dehydroquinate dehydratase [Fusobacterium simiae]MDC7954351.1 type I 3-dehydroquinate dehydratase [Fusobacterium simiae]